MSDLDLPVSTASPWVDMSRVAAAIARDVVTRVMDDRPPELRRLQASEVRIRLVASQRIKPRRILYPRPAEPNPRIEGTPAVREYFRLYQRERREWPGR